MGDVLGDINTKRARVQGMDQSAGKSIVTAFVPLAEMQQYAADLRSTHAGARRLQHGIRSLRRSAGARRAGHHRTGAEG